MSGSDRDGDGKDSVAIWNDLFATNSIQAAPFGVTINENNISPNNESVDGSPTNPITHGVAGTITQFAYAAGCSMTIDPTKNASVRGAVWTTSSHTNANVMVAYGTFGAGKFVAIGDSSPADDGTGASGDTLFDGWNDAGGDDGRPDYQRFALAGDRHCGRRRRRTIILPVRSLSQGHPPRSRGPTSTRPRKSVNQITAATPAVNRSGGNGPRHHRAT